MKAEVSPQHHRSDEQRQGKVPAITDGLLAVWLRQAL